MPAPTPMEHKGMIGILNYAVYRIILLNPLQAMVPVLIIYRKKIVQSIYVVALPWAPDLVKP
jgi:hypothetical protein